MKKRTLQRTKANGDNNMRSCNMNLVSCKIDIVNLRLSTEFYKKSQINILN